MVNASDEIQEDDEAVRCICGYDDYPGPPPLDPEMKQARDADSIVFTGLDVTDDISGFYVQCDICKVWQHGACVGIMTEESSPDEYFCEKCRKDLHKIHKATNGYVLMGSSLPIFTFLASLFFRFFVFPRWPSPQGLVLARSRNPLHPTPICLESIHYLSYALANRDLFFLFTDNDTRPIFLSIEPREPPDLPQLPKRVAVRLRMVQRKVRGVRRPLTRSVDLQ